MMLGDWKFLSNCVFVEGSLASVRAKSEMVRLIMANFPEVGSRSPVVKH